MARGDRGTAGLFGRIRADFVTLIGTPCLSRRRSPHWIKVKNRQHHGFSRVMDQL